MDYGFTRFAPIWILFAGGFLFPPLFLLLLPAAALYAYRSLIDEYEEIFIYLKRKTENTERESAPKSKNVSSQTALSFCEMV